MEATVRYYPMPPKQHVPVDATLRALLAAKLTILLALDGPK